MRALHIRFGLATLLLAFAFTALPAFAAGTVNNNAWWKDTAGNYIIAQGGNISKFGSTYYWYGVQYSGSESYITANNGETPSNVFQSVNVYSSTDLVNWTGYNPVVTTSTSGFGSVTWVGRLSTVLYNSSTKLYVMWIVYNGEDGDGEICLTSSSPTGPFTVNHVQDGISGVYDSINGDSTIFVDVDHGSTPYFICSDAHGREHAYISTLSSNYESINAATLISEWPQGQEANNMFERSGVYYYNMSQTHGFGYSAAYVVWSTTPTDPSDYTKDAEFNGTWTDSTYWSQVGNVQELKGSSETSYFMMSDRWANFDDDYWNAGHGLGYYVWSPLTFSGDTPTFNNVSTLTVDSATGVLTW